MWYSRLRLTSGLTKIFLCSINPVRTCYMDTIDEFTMNLMRTKSKKWEAIRAAWSDNRDCKIQMVHSDVIKQLEEINHKAVNEIDPVVMQSLLKQSYEENLTPSYICLDRIAMWSFRVGDKEVLELCLKIAKQNYNYQLVTDASWEYYKAAMQWKRGDVIGGLKKIELLYDDNKYLRKKIRVVVRYLLKTIIAERGEAALLAAVETCKRLNEKHKEWYLLMCIWHCCFLSEWYSDQCISYEILKESPILHTYLPYHISVILRSALKNNQPEVMHRLIELLLNYRHIHEEQIQLIVQVLFNYKFRNRDFSSCSEIIQWAQTENIKISPLLQKRLLLIYLNNGETTTPMVNIKKPEFKLRF